MNISAVRDLPHSTIRFELRGDSDYPLKDRVKYLFIASVTLLVAQIALAFFLELPMIAFIYMAITIGFIFYANRVITEAGKYPTPAEHQALQDKVDDLAQSLQEAKEEHTTEKANLQQKLKTATQEKTDQINLLNKTHEKTVTDLKKSMKDERETAEHQIKEGYEKQLSDLKAQHGREQKLLSDNLKEQKKLLSKLSDVQGLGENKIQDVLNQRIKELETKLEKKDNENKLLVEKLNSVELQKKQLLGSSLQNKVIEANIQKNKEEEQQAKLKLEAYIRKLNKKKETLDEEAKKHKEKVNKELQELNQKYAELIEKYKKRKQELQQEVDRVKAELEQLKKEKEQLLKT